jgi:2-polyprenyl-6-hydroxyphenyl methylase/3-demethylubiquinone-9 3-methyltransferase
MISTVDTKEIEKFAKIADEWWDVNGKFRPLHLFNPVRTSYIKSYIEKYFYHENLCGDFSNLTMIDIGCGGGIFSEEMAKLNAKVTAIDASEKNIAVAKIHSQKSQLNIDYQIASSEDFIAKNSVNNNIMEFDVVFALEVIEHVADVNSFIKNCASLQKKGGLLFIATINRNIKSLLTAKIAAEYILNWLPKGTHNWQKFLQPQEIDYIARDNSLKLLEITGFNYSLLKNQWQISSKNFDVNYIMVFEKI